MSSLLPPASRPSVPRSLGNHEARIRALERKSGGLRVIAGSIEGGSGDIHSGTGGFTVSAQVGDDYTVIFDPELTALPIVLAGYSGPTFVFTETDVIGVSQVATTGFIASAALGDDWAFIAVVPPA